MDAFRVERIDELASIHGGAVKLAGDELGLQSFGLQVLDFPAGFAEYPEHARMLFLSMPAGIEDYVRALAEPARWSWLQPPAAGPRVAPERLAAAEREFGVIRHGPPPVDPKGVQ